jgi:transposase
MSYFGKPYPLPREDKDKLEKLLTMSKKELTRLEVMQRLEEKRLKQREAATILGISERHVRRLYRAYRHVGEQGLISKRRGKVSNHRLRPELVVEVRDLIYERYEDFGPTLAHEKLTEVHGLKLSRESVRRIMIEEGIWKPRKVKRPPVHQMR